MPGPAHADVPTQLSVAEAIAAVAAVAPAPRSVEVSLDRALGTVLRAELTSLADHPSVDNSALDGYACRFADAERASAERPVRLRVVDEIAAGSRPAVALRPGEAARIFTGAPVPEGADAIVAVERTREDGDDVLLLAPAGRGDVRRRAQDLERGRPYLLAGRRLDAAAVALAAAMGHERVRVAVAPRIAMLTTGDEVVAPGRTLEPGQVYDSNAASVAALARAAGAEVVTLPRVHDDVDALQDALVRAGRVDLLVTSGGVSMGKHDIVRDLLFERGEVIFWKVAMKPGGPGLFGRFGGLPVLGLPGNPVSSMVAFLLLGRAFIDAALGRTGSLPYHRRRWAVASTPFRGAGAKECFHRGIVTETEEGARVASVASQSSGVLRSMAEASALVLVPPHGNVSAGERVQIVPLEPHLG